MVRDDRSERENKKVGAYRALVAFSRMAWKKERDSWMMKRYLLVRDDQVFVLIIHTYPARKASKGTKANTLPLFSSCSVHGDG